MGENAINSFGFMGREGPCFHCGIEHTPLWRSGPPEKPVLCNACGSRWRTRGTLEDYFPKHANKDSYSHQSSKFLSRINLTSSSSTQKLEELPILESNIDVGHDQSLTDFGDGTIKGINSAPGVALSEQNIEGAVQHPPWVPNNVSKKKRSVLDQRVLSPTERLHQQLCHAMQEAEVSKESDDEDVLIYERINHYIAENEIGLGCMLLKPSSSPAKNSKP